MVDCKLGKKISFELKKIHIYISPSIMLLYLKAYNQT